MKNSSIAILAALAVSGAAGVYLATRDPAEETVEDVSTQAADGSGGGDVITKGERCAELTGAIPNLEQKVLDKQQELSDYLADDGPARKIARDYRAKYGGGSKDSRRKHETETYDYIRNGTPHETVPERFEGSEFKPLADNARDKVKTLETEIASLQKNLNDLKTERDGYLSDGVSACA